MRTTRPLRAIVIAAAAVIALSACASGQDAAEQAASSPAASVPAASTPPASSPVSGADMAGHIHNLAYDGRRLLLGTHEGLWGQDPGTVPVQVSDEPFDVMGFTSTEDRWLASGHPGEGMDAPADLGLLESIDRGRSWTEVSLGGEVDFHRLVTSGTSVLGVNAHDGRLLRSEDGGTTWTDLGVPGLYDVAASPTDPSIVVGTTENGPVRSTDAGASFAPVADAPLIALLAWAGDTVYGADVDGQVIASTDEGITWNIVGSLPAQPTALAARGDSIAALVDDTVLESVDGGTSFSPRLTGLGGH